ncbi:MAG: citrate lyase subunit alpha, partial [Bacilli bacterium]
NLDFVILGATEIDLDFNVNVTTSSSGLIMGGSGGHSDTAHGAKLTIIVSPTMKARTPIIKDKVTVITTPGEDVDVLVTERGIAINPRRFDLIEQFKNSKLKIVSIKKLLEMTHKYTGIPKNVEFEKRVVGVVEYRDGSIIDSIFQVRNNYEL